MSDALISYWHLTIRWLQSHIGLVSLLVSLLSFLATLFRPTLWRRIVFTAAAGFAGVLFSLYEPVGQIAVAGRSLILGLVFIGAFWWAIGQYEKWLGRKQPLPRQVAGTFETVADTVRQIMVESKDSGFEAALTSQGNTLIVKKTPPHRKN